MAWETLAPIVIRRLSSDLNLTPQQAAGVVGQLGHESAGLQAINEENPAVPGSRGGFGWAQWTGPRRQAFEQWAAENKADVSDPEANYQFLLHELKDTPEGRVLPALRAAPDAQAAGRVFTDQFLRPGVPAYDSRASWTQRALDFILPTAQAGTLPQEQKMSMAERIQKARDAGFNDEEILARIQGNADMAARIQKARDAGFTDEEIYGRMGLSLGKSGQQASSAQQDAPAQSQTPDRGLLESIGAGLGYGTGQAGLGAQEWLGKGLQAVGADTAGGWLEQDAQAGRKRLAQEFEPYRQAHPVAATAGQIGGNVAATIGPVGLFGKAVGALGKVMPYAERLGQAISSGGFRLGAPAGQTGMQLLANAGTRAAGGAVAGGMSAGMVNPEDTGTGAMIGAATPAIIKPAALLGRALTTGAKSLAEPFYQSGRNQIIGRLLNEAAGPDAAAVRNRLSGMSPSPIGVQQTAAEVAESPGIATLQRTATQTDPVVSAELSSRAIRNDDARQAAIEGIIPDRTAAVTARQQATEPLYQAAYGKSVTITPEIDSLMKRPSMRQALGKAASLAQETGDAIDLDRGLTGQAAHYIKMALDDMVNSASVTGLTGNQLRAIRDTRSAFLKEIEGQIPEYAQARAAYQNLSKPINQADVLREILDRGAPNKARGNITPAALARALRDRTAQSVTGQKNATLEGVLSDDQRRVLADVLGSLQASDFANTAGKGVGSDTVQKLAYSNMLNRFGVLEGFRVNPFTSTAGNLLARVGSAAYGMANNQLRQELAQALLDPKTTANLMSQGVPNAQLQRLANALRNTEQIGYRALPLAGAPLLNQ